MMCRETASVHIILLRKVAMVADVNGHCSDMYVDSYLDYILCSYN
jgi:hypothetical protein